MIRFRSHHYAFLLAAIVGIACLLWLRAPRTFEEHDSKASSNGDAADSTSAALPPESGVAANDAPRAQMEAITPASATTMRPALPALEARFIADRQARLEAVRETLTTNRFEQDFQLLENAMTQSADALALRDIYRDAIAQQIAHAGLGSGSERLACGLTLCMGSLQTAGKDDRYRMWWNDFTSSSQTPHGTAFDFPHTLADGSIEHRFFFSTDPAASIVKLPPVP
jgi:hypothetical protein